MQLGEHKRLAKIRKSLTDPKFFYNIVPRNINNIFFMGSKWQAGYNHIITICNTNK